MKKNQLCWVLLVGLLAAGCTKSVSPPAAETGARPTESSVAVPPPVPKKPIPEAEGTLVPETFTVDKSMKEARTQPFEAGADLSDIHFKYDRAELDEASKETLRRNAEWLMKRPGIKVEVQGHCDERGTSNYNLGLGERRAIAAKKFLMALGIEANRIYTLSYGEEQPVCAEDSEACRAKNRRVHFLTSPKH